MCIMPQINRLGVEKIYLVVLQEAVRRNTFWNLIALYKDSISINDLMFTKYYEKKYISVVLFMATYARALVIKNLNNNTTNVILQHSKRL